MADGNWVFLKPLSPGVHKIIFKGGVQQQQQTKIVGRNSSNNVSGTSSFAFPSGWDYPATYNIIVPKSSIIRPTTSHSTS
jgi:hypothetical protein